MCQVWLKLACLFWRRRILNFVLVFSLFRNYLPFEQTRILITQGRFVPSLVEIGPVILHGEEDENVKSLLQRRQQRRTMDKLSEKFT